MKTAAKVLLLLIAIVAVAYWYLNRPPLGQILVFSKTDEYRHDSIAAGIEALRELAGEHRFEVIATEDAAVFSEQNLPSFSAVVFINTTGTVLDRTQQDAFQRYIQAGGGYVGIHAAADTHWKDNDWPWYTRLVGGAFLSHPSDPSNVQSGKLRVIDNDSPLTAMFESEFDFTDEWYDYHRLSRNIKVLLRIDESTYQGGVMGADHPVAWYQDFDGGRSFYTNFGHRAESYQDPRIRDHLWAGIAYAMGSAGTGGEGASGLDYSRSAPEHWRLKRVILDSGLDEPMSMAFTPDGEIYYVQRKGSLMRYDTEQQKSVEAGRLDVFTEGEYGLIGIAFDPDFANSGWVYLFANVLTDTGAAYRLSRYTVADGLLDHSSAQVVLEFATEAVAGNHTGGALVFGTGGELWISTGDTTNPHASDGFSPHDDRPGEQIGDASRSAGNTMDLRGKILRIVPTEEGYRIPDGNLFNEGDKERAQGRPEIYAMGLRNPFRFSVDTRTGTLYWGEIGPDSRDYSDSRGPWGYDEFNRTQTPGNFGWPFLIGNNEAYARYDFATAEAGAFFDAAAPENLSRNNTGAAQLPPAQPAWIAYPYDLSEAFIELGAEGRSAMAGPVYYSEDYPPSATKLPPYYDGKLFIYEWMRHWVQTVQMDADGDILKIEPLQEVGLYSAPIDLKFAPDGNLYLLEYGSAWFSQNDDAFLTRIEYYGDPNPPPVVVAAADRTAGAAPFTTQLRGSDSFDRNGEFGSLQFSWDRVENGRMVAHVADTPDAQFTATEAGDYQLQLTVTDADGVSSEDGVLLAVGNEPPEIGIAISRGNSSLYRDGGSVSYQVQVSDLEDGSVDDGGIDPARVAVSLQFLPQGEDLANVVLGHQSAAPEQGWSAMEDSDCLSCHALDKASVGPSFTQIRQRYAGEQGAQARIVDSILNGNSGGWGDYAMPAHPRLDEAAAVMASWILNLDAAVAAPGLPLTGTLDFDQHQGSYVESGVAGRLNTGRYILLASYTDRGAPGARPQTVTVAQRWLPPLLGSTVFSQLRHVLVMPIPIEGMQGASIAIYQSVAGESSWARLDAMDLSDVARVRVGVGTTSLITRGGHLGIRIGAPDGQSLGIEVVENTSMGIPDTLDYYEFDASAVQGVHDVYIVSEHPPEENSARPAFIFGTVEFLEK